MGSFSEQSFIGGEKRRGEQFRLMATGGFIFGVLLLFCTLGLAVFILYTAAADMQPWAMAHLLRILFGLGIILVILWVPLGTWFQAAYWLYGLNVVLLVLIPFFGVSNMGAQRWFYLGSLSVQPSEPMKVCAILALARYFHLLHPKEVLLVRHIIIPAGIVALPTLLIINQPDLGTSLMILFGGVVTFFLVGVRWQNFAALFSLTAVCAFPIWTYVLHDFQRQRILSFIAPEKDLLGAGYQLMQSKIAIGSGGWLGNGFLQGTQSLLGFIPAKHTDFIFALHAEQFGFWGGLAILGLIFTLMLYCVLTASMSHSTFARLMVLSIGSLWIIQSIVNLAMVMGLLPVVGVPLPFFSYGGTSLWTSMAAFGFVLNAYINQYNSLRNT